MTNVLTLVFRIDLNLLETGKNPGKLKNLFNKSSLVNIKELVINLS